MARYDFIQFAFTTGILAPSFHGRTDLRPYDSGLYDAVNFFVDANGGIVSRPGTRVVGLLSDTASSRFFRFRANTEQDGSDFLGVIVSDPEHFSYVSILRNGREIVFSERGAINCPYEAEHLQSLEFTQYRNQLLITHPEYPPCVVTRHTDDTWTFEQVTGQDNFEFPQTG